MTEQAVGILDPVRTRLESILQSIQIPPRPAIVNAVLVELESEQPNFRDLGAMLTQDVGIAGGLLKTANSPVFGFRTRSTTVHEALTMLGLLMTARTVAGLALRATFGSLKGLEAFWDKSARMALASAWIVRNMGVIDGVRAQDAHTYGLFRDCGVVLMASAKIAEPPATHGAIGAALAHEWGLPAWQCEAIASHQDPAVLAADHPAKPQVKRMIAIGALAEYMQDRAANAAQSDAWLTMQSATLALLDVTAERAADMRTTLLAELAASV